MSTRQGRKSLFASMFGDDWKSIFDEPVHNEEFFDSSTITHTTPVHEDSNDSVEYKVVTTHSLLSDGRLEDNLNKLGAEGWELVVWDGSRVIFMRF